MDSEEPILVDPDSESPSQPDLDPAEVALLSRAIRIACAGEPPIGANQTRKLARRSASLLFGDASDAELLQSLGLDEFPSGRAEALIAVLRSDCRPEEVPWQPTLDIAGRGWPEWGAPFLLAAQHFIATGDADSARAALLEVPRRYWVLDAAFLVTHDRFLGGRSGTQPTREQALDIAMQLARHAPRVTNINRAAQLARSTRGEIHIERMRRLLVLTHGLNPSQWKGMTRYDDLSAAGSLCALLARHAALRKNSQAVMDWGEAAVLLLSRSLTAENLKGRSDDPRMYAKVRIAETLVALAKQKLTDGSLSPAWLDNVEVRVQEFVEESEHFSFVRLLALIATLRARWMMLRGATTAMIEEAVALARRRFAWLDERAYASKRAEVRDWLVLFLIQMSRWDEALGLIAGCRDPHGMRAHLEITRGRRRYAVPHLLEQLAGPRTAGQQLIIARRLHGCMKHLDALGVSLTPRLAHEVRRALRRRLPLFIGAASRSLRLGRLRAARRQLEMAEYADRDRRAANTLHLGLRIELAAKIRGLPAPHLHERFAQCLAHFRDESARPDPFIRSILLAALARGISSEVLDEAEVWSMVTGAPHGLRDDDVVDVTAALTWQIHTGSMSHWVLRYLGALRQFPGDERLSGLLGRLWREHGTRSIAAIVGTLHALTGTNGDLRLAISLLRQLSGECIAEPRVREAMRRLVLAAFGEGDRVLARQFAQTAGSGLALWQLNAWAQPDECRRRVREGAAWIEERLDERVRDDAYANWLGAHRERIESIVASDIQADLEPLHHRIAGKREDAAESLVAWFESVAVHTRTRPETGPAAAPGEALIVHALDAWNRYTPRVPDPEYWRILELEAAGFRMAIPEARRAAECADLWLRLQTRLVDTARVNSLAVALAVLHDLKSEMLESREQPTPRVRRRLRHLVGRTMEYLGSFRREADDVIDLAGLVTSRTLRKFRETGVHDPDRPSGYLYIEHGVHGVRGDARLLGSAIDAVIANARRATRDLRGAGNVMVCVRRDGDDVVVSVRDNGVGLEPDQLEGLNDPLARPFSDFGSSGLGSRLVHRIVRRHGGLVSVHSRGRDLGCTVQMRLPATAVPSERGHDHVVRRTHFDR